MGVTHHLLIGMIQVQMNSFKALTHPPLLRRSTPQKPNGKHIIKEMFTMEQVDGTHLKNISGPNELHFLEGWTQIKI